MKSRRRKDTNTWRASDAYKSPRKIYPHVRQPRPTQAEAAALARMQTDEANPIDYENAKFLIRHCAAYGCAFVREKGERGQAACPGWCQLKWKYEAETIRMTKAWPTKERIKPKALSQKEIKTFRELTNGQATSENLLIAEGLIRACKADGCAHVIGSAAETKSGICICPGWCEIRDEALARKWTNEDALDEASPSSNQRKPAAKGKVAK